MGWKYSFAKTPLKAAQAPLAAARASQEVVLGGGACSEGSVSLSGDWTPRSGSADVLTWLDILGDGEAGEGRMLRRMGLVLTDAGSIINECVCNCI